MFLIKNTVENLISDYKNGIKERVDSLSSSIERINNMVDGIKNAIKTELEEAKEEMNNNTNSLKIQINKINELIKNNSGNFNLTNNSFESFINDIKSSQQFLKEKIIMLENKQNNYQGENNDKNSKFLESNNKGRFLSFNDNNNNNNNKLKSSSNDINENLVNLVGNLVNENNSNDRNSDNYESELEEENLIDEDQIKLRKLQKKIQTKELLKRLKNNNNFLGNELRFKEEEKNKGNEDIYDEKILDLMNKIKEKLKE